MIIVHGQSVTFDFSTYDDGVLLLTNPRVAEPTWTHLVELFQEATRASFTPIRYLSHWLDFWIWGQFAGGHHLTSVLLHGLNALVVALTLPAFGMSRSVSFTCALLFGIHPITVESVAWISGRKELLYVGFLLTSVLSLRAYLFSNSSAMPAFLAVSSLSYLAASLSKVTAVTLFPLLILISILWKPGIRTAVAGFLYSVIAVTIGVLNKISFYSESTDSAPWLSVLIAGTKSFWVHMSNLLFPFLLSPFQYVDPPHNFWSFDALLPLLAAAGGIGIVGSGLVQRKRWAVIAVLIVAPLISVVITPAALIVAANRYLYFSAIPFCLFFAISLSNINRQSGTLLTVLIAATLGILTFFQAKIWKNGETLVAYHMNHYLHSPSALIFSVRHYIYAGQPEAAFRLAIRVLQDRPATAGTLDLSLAVLFHQLELSELRDIVAAKYVKGRHGGLSEDLLRIAINPNEFGLLKLRKEPITSVDEVDAMIEAGNYLEALVQLTRFYERNRNDLGARVRLARLSSYFNLGAIAEYYLEGLPLESTATPDYIETRLRLAVYDRDLPEAVQWARALVQKEPENNLARQILGLRTSQ